MGLEKGAVYGHIPNFPVGSVFKNRRELMETGVHAQLQAGIHGDSHPNGGAFSICLSDGYEDDVDNGERITYVGSGGQDTTGRQIMNQSRDDPPNKSLFISCETKRPVRVIRGTNSTSYYSPASGLRYDGLYVVDSAEMRPGKKGYLMCFFRLRRLDEDGQGPIPNRRLLSEKKMANMLRHATK